MSKDRLVITGEPGEWALAWEVDGEIGLFLGQERATEAQLAKATPDEWEALAADLACVDAARATRGVRCRQSGRRVPCNAFVWEAEKDARAARAVVMAEMAARRRSRPMPEWAKTATANGWKPPKGWTP